MPSRGSQSLKKFGAWPLKKKSRFGAVMQSFPQRSRGERGGLGEQHSQVEGQQAKGKMSDPLPQGEENLSC